MILIGMFDSPFVRRVAVSLRLLDVPFEHRNWSVHRDLELIRQFNPLGRVPALVRPDGEALIDSHAILDFLDGAAGPDRALLPPAGDERRRAMHIIALAVGAAEKGLALLEETVFRPRSKSYEPHIDRVRSQMHGALAEIDRMARMQAGGWLIAGRMTQADITLACMFGFLCDALQLRGSGTLYPGLTSLSARCEELPAFRELRASFTPGEPAFRPENHRSAL